MSNRAMLLNNPRKNTAPTIRYRWTVARRLGMACICVSALATYAARPPLCSAQASTAHTVQAQDATSDIVEALRAGNFDRALQLSKIALDKSPSDYRLWTLRGMAYASASKPAAALTAYQHALKLAPAYLPALEGAAQIEYGQGRDGAKQLILRILALLPADPTSHAMLAVIDYKAKNCAEAIPHFQQARALLEAQPQLLTEYASCLATLSRYEEVIPVLEQALKIDPKRQDARYNLALAQWNANRTQDALATLQPLIATNPDDEDVLTLAADIYESNNDTPHAVELLRQAILANPKKVGAYLQFSTLSYNHSSLQVGIDMLNTGLTQLPDEPRLYLARAILYSEKGDFSRAMEDFETVNRLDPNLSFAGVAEGLARSEQHKSKEALVSFRAAAKAHPNDSFTQYLLAEALSEQNLAPGTPEYAEAIAAATRATTLDPRQLSALNLLSTLSLRDGHTQLAIDYSQKALAVDPNDPQALYHLLLALRKTDRKDEIPAVLKRLIVARDATQSGMPKKRYKLDEVPATQSLAPVP
ncbi:MAG TPA: tetratricopeptide repeat protein [Edaphobacter sp.]|jgi:tetratricopeptide (TPR) repeat protein|nr:tetratricopeptide repeat protein [Edaphobacter sp.]